MLENAATEHSAIRVRNRFRLDFVRNPTGLRLMGWGSGPFHTMLKGKSTSGFFVGLEETMITPEYRTNRARFPREELARYQGQWVAFSADGCHVVAAADSLDGLEERLEAAGADPRKLVLEGVPGPEDTLPLGGEELH